jgi:lipopolysaccharide export system protein LptC
VSQLGELIDEELHAPARRLSLARVSLLAAIGGFSALILYVTFYSGSRYTPMVKIEDPNRIDFYLNDATSRAFNEQGELASITTSPRTEFFEDTQIALLTTPIMDLRRANGERWIIKSQQGQWQEDLERLTLSGNVDAQRSPEAMTITTEKLLAYPKTKQAETDLAVTIRTPTGILRAIGMQADLNADRIEFLQDVRGHYDAR